MEDAKRERETTPITIIGMNEGRFTLIIATSSYVKPGQVYKVGLWDKCYCEAFDMRLLPHARGQGAKHSSNNQPFFYLYSNINKTSSIKHEIITQAFFNSHSRYREKTCTSSALKCTPQAPSYTLYVLSPQALFKCLQTLKLSPLTSHLSNSPTY